jgi:hypothetical protein
MRKIAEFLAHREAEGKKIHKLPPRRRTKSLTTWTPDPAATVTITTDASGDPDPPLTS